MKRMTTNINGLCCIALLLSIGLSSSLNAQEVNKPKEATFDIKALSKFGEKKYKMTWIDRSSGTPVEHDRGIMTLSATVTKDAVTLKNITRMFMPDGKRYIEYQAECTCAPDGSLSLRQMELKVVRSDGVVVSDSRSVVEQDIITHKFTAGGKAEEKQEKWAKGTVVELAEYFLVPQLPQKEGERVRLGHVQPFPTNSIQKTTSQTITCHGIDPKMSTGGKPLTKFVSETKGEKEVTTYWVDSEGVPRRVLVSPENRLDLIEK